MTRLAAIVLERGADEEAHARLLKRLELGLPEDALALAELSRTLGRGDLLALRDAGLLAPADVLAAPSRTIERLVGRRAAALIAPSRDAGEAA